MGHQVLQHGSDGRHVHPAVVGLVAWMISCPVLFTDAIAASGVGDGTFVLGGQEVRVHEGEARLTSTESLAGSTLTMSEGLRRAVRDSGLSVEQASAATSANPARVLGLEASNWIRLVVWLAVGMVVYVGYGYRHSVLRRERNG